MVRTQGCALARADAAVNVLLALLDWRAALMAHLLDWRAARAA